MKKRGWVEPPPSDLPRKMSFEDWVWSAAEKRKRREREEAKAKAERTEAAVTAD